MVEQLFIDLEQRFNEIGLMRTPDHDKLMLVWMKSPGAVLTVSNVGGEQTMSVAHHDALFSQLLEAHKI